MKRLRFNEGENGSGVGSVEQKIDEHDQLSMVNDSEAPAHPVCILDKCRPIFLKNCFLNFSINKNQLAPYYIYLNILNSNLFISVINGAN